MKTNPSLSLFFSHFLKDREGVRVRGTQSTLPILAGALILGGGNLHAAISTWTGAGANDNWATGANWGGTAPTASVTTDLTFAGTTRLTPVNNILAGSAFQTITFASGAGAFTLAGNSIALSNNTVGGIVNSSGINQTVTLNLAIGGAGNTRTFTTASGGGDLTIGVSSDSTKGIISGAGVLAIAGTGKVFLYGNNTYGSTTMASGATLILGSATAAGTGTLTLGGTIDTATSAGLTLTNNQAITIGSDFTFGGTGNLNLGTGAVTLTNATGTGARTITLGGTNRTLIFGGAVTGSSTTGSPTLTINGAGNTVVFNSSFNVNNSGTGGQSYTINGDGNLTVNGALSAGTGSPARKVTYAGTGTLTLAGANTYTGVTTVAQGTAVAVADSLSATAGAFGNASSAIVFGDTSLTGAASILTGVAVTIGRSITEVASATNSKLTIGGAQTSGTSTYTGNITLTRPTTLVSATGGTVEFKTGTWTTGNNAITVGSTGNAGTVQLSNALSTTGGVTVAFGTLAANSTLTGSVAVASGATLKGTGTVGAITGTGTIAPGSSPGILTASSVTLGAPGESFAFELTASSPNYTSPTGSLNDVLRLTSGTPLNGTATSANLFNVYFDVSSVTGGASFQGGLFTDASASFTSAISGGTYNYFVLGDGSGTHAYNGVNYYTLAEYDSSLNILVGTTLIPTANFGSVVNNGYVMEFDVAAVPEPGTWAMLLGGLAALVVVQRRAGATRRC